MVKPIYHCLNTNLLELEKRVIALEDLNNKLKLKLASPLRDYCQVAAFNSGRLVIGVVNAAWATELRYQLPELRDRLRKDGLHQLTSISVILADKDPKILFNKRSPQKLSLSDDARNCIEKASEQCHYPALKSALARLARK